MRYPNAPRPCLISCLCSLVLIVLVQASAIAQDSVRVAYINPLSGGGASIGEVGVKTFQFLADEINAKGGVLGKKLEIVPYDNKLNPQESLVQVQKAIDTGIRIVTQGNGSSVAAAISDFAAKFNERNPGREFLFLNYAAVDPVLTNDKCNYWHFRWDANSDIKMEALTNYMKTRPSIKKLYLINQDYSFGQAVRAAAKTMLSAKRPDIQIVGDEMHPLLKITDFAPYVAKIKASRPFGQWRDDDYDVLENGVVGRPHLLPRCSRAAGPSLDVGERPQTATSNAPACGYEPTREAPMAASLKAGDASDARRAG